MKAASISEVLSAWEAAARSVDRNLPAGIVERWLAFLPEPPEWTISEDASALFALAGDDVVFTLGVSSDSEWRLLSRPLYADRLFLRLSWSQPEPTDTGGLTWNTEWMSTTATSVGTTSGNACADPLAATRMEPKASMRASGLREQSRREQGGR